MLSGVDDAQTALVPEEPFPGIEPYSYSDRCVFFGREIDARNLVRLVVMYRGVLLYSESGSGKTSLINAGLIPLALAEGYQPEKIRVQPIIGQEIVVERLTETTKDGLQVLNSMFPFNENSHHAILSVQRFQEVLGQNASKVRPLLIFDQFEEWITLFEEKAGSVHAAHEAIRDAIVAVLRASNLPVKIMISLREDYLAKLTPIFEAYPSLPDQYLRLTALQGNQIREMIRGPFETYPAKYSREISALLAEEIQRQFTARSDSRSIRASEVQIVCRSLFENSVDSQDLEKVFAQTGGVQKILERYLEDVLGSLKEDLREPAVCLLRRMVTAAGTRNVIQEEDLLSRVQNEDEIPRDKLQRALRNLESDSKLIRREPRRDVYYFEITSEFLVAWIREKSVEHDRRAEQNKLRLAQMEAQKQKCLAEKEARTSRYLRLGLLALMVILACTIGISLYAWKERSVATKASEEAAAATLIARDRQKEATAATLTARAKQEEVEAMRAEANGLHQLAAQLWNQAEQNRETAKSLQLPGPQPGQPIEPDSKAGAVQIARERDDALQSLRQSESKLTETAEQNKELKIYVLELEKRIRGGPPPPPPPPPISPPAITGDVWSARLTEAASKILEQDGDLAVWLSLYAFKSASTPSVRDDAEATLRKAVWKMQALPTIEIGAGPRHISRFAFSPDGTKLFTLTDGSPKTAEIWDVESGHLVTTLPGHADRKGHKSEILTATFSQDGKLVVTGAGDGTAILWEAATGKQLRTITEKAEISEIAHISISPDGSLLALSDGSQNREAVSGNRARLWSLRSPSMGPSDLSTIFDGSVTSFEFSKDSGLLALGTIKGVIVLYDIASAKVRRRFSNDLDRIRKLAISDDKKKLAALDQSGDLRIWDLTSYHSLRVSGILEGAVDDMAFDRGGRLLVSTQSANHKAFAVSDAESGEDVETLDLSVKLNWISAFGPDAQLMAILDQQRKHLRIYARDPNRMADLARSYLQVHRKLSDKECQLYFEQAPCPLLR